MIRPFLLAAAILSVTPALSASATRFVRDAVRGDVSKITLGRVITVRGASPAARSFGTVLVRDHSRGLAQAQALAKRFGINAPAMMMPEARAELVKLRYLGGRAFDREVRSYMIADHKNDLAEFRAQVRTGDRQTIGFAAATIPVLERHLALAQSLPK